MYKYEINGKMIVKDTIYHLLYAVSSEGKRDNSSILQTLTPKLMKETGFTKTTVRNQIRNDILTKILIYNKIYDYNDLFSDDSHSIKLNKVNDNTYEKNYIIINGKKYYSTKSIFQILQFKKKHNIRTNNHPELIKYIYNLTDEEINQHNNENKLSLEKLIKIHGKEKGQEMWNNIINTRKETMKRIGKEIGDLKTHYVNKYGKEEGLKKWNEYKEKLKYSNSLQGYIDKYGKEEGTKIFNEAMEKAHYSTSKQYFIDKYGKERGEIEYQKFIENRKITKEKLGKNRYNEYINKLSYHLTLEGMKEKYGEKEGEKRYNEMIEKRRKSLSLEGFINKYGKFEGKIKWNEFIDKTLRQSNKMHSKESSLFFDTIIDTIYKNIPKDILSSYIQYKSYKYKEYFNSEYYIWNDDNLYYYDFVDHKHKIVIEFNGEKWHEYMKMKDNEYWINPYSKETYLVKDLKEKWNKKINTVKQKGYKIYIVWEGDLKLNRKNNNILNEINRIFNNINI